MGSLHNINLPVLAPSRARYVSKRRRIAECVLWIARFVCERILGQRVVDPREEDGWPPPFVRRLNRSED